MTGWGEKIPNVTLAELKERLGRTDDDGKAVKRLFTAIAYKQGLSPAEIEETYGVSRKNVYLWLDRIEERGLEDALYDDPKPGRPPKLTDDERTRLAEFLEDSPTTAGFEADAWTPALVQRLIQSRFDVEYTRRHVRRLLDDMGIRWRRSSTATRSVASDAES